jgi:hypothetical protein
MLSTSNLVSMLNLAPIEPGLPWDRLESSSMESMENEFCKLDGKAGESLTYRT